jgi:NAD(P)-dependent dehydrogenase (short-subunit alcohol dehydrogenase family)
MTILNAQASSLLLNDAAVVTGAAQGNGAAIARGLAAHGARVAVLDRDLGGAQAIAADIVAAGGQAVAVLVDVTDPSDCLRAAETIRTELGQCSILVNNAGVIRRIPIGDPEFMDSVDFTYRVNVLGVAHMVQVLLPQLIASQGRIVNLGSIASFLSTPGGAGYAASKGAVLQLTKTMAAELAVHGIRVNAIAPGVIVTPMTEVTRKNPETAAKFLAHTPLGRFGEPEELVGPVVFLASSMSSYITGVMLPVDGGYLTL